MRKNSAFGKFFVDIMALVVACTAIFISIQQGNSQKEVERQNKQPFLNIEYDKTDANEIKGIKLRNLGYGPAIIKSFKYYRNEQDFKTSSNPLTEYTPLFPVLGFKFEKLNYLVDGYTLGYTCENDQIYLMGTTADSTYFGNQPGQYFESRTRKLLDSLVFEIEYVSMSSADPNVYYLRFGELLTPSNYREER